MSAAFVAIFFVVHGMISAACGLPHSSAGQPATPNPAWLAWWPTTLGRSWLIDRLRLGSGAETIGMLLWVASGVAFAAAGLGLLGLPGLNALWPQLALGGAGVGLAAMALYLHPWYALGIALNVLIVVLLARGAAG